MFVSDSDAGSAHRGSAVSGMIIPRDPMFVKGPERRGGMREDRIIGIPSEIQEMGDRGSRKRVGQDAWKAVRIFAPIFDGWAACWKGRMVGFEPIALCASAFRLLRDVQTVSARMGKSGQKWHTRRESKPHWRIWSPLSCH